MLIFLSVGNLVVFELHCSFQIYITFVNTIMYSHQNYVCNHICWLCSKLHLE